MLHKAAQFAAAAHRGQARKYTGDDYINHPIAVAAIVASHGGDDAMVAAAILHDVVEDTSTTSAVVKDIFGDDVAGLVDDLTDVSKPGDGNRAARKALDRGHTAAASDRAQIIKLADLIDNAASIGAHDPKFARVFFAEMAALLGVIRVKDHPLYAVAQQLLMRR